MSCRSTILLIYLPPYTMIKIWASKFTNQSKIRFYVFLCFCLYHSPSRPLTLRAHVIFLSLSVSLISLGPAISSAFFIMKQFTKSKLNALHSFSSVWFYCGHWAPYLFMFTYFSCLLNFNNTMYNKRTRHPFT